MEERLVSCGFVEKKKDRIKGGGLRWVTARVLNFFLWLLIKGLELKSSWPIFNFEITSSFFGNLPELFIALE